MFINSTLNEAPANVEVKFTVFGLNLRHPVSGERGRWSWHWLIAISLLLVGLIGRPHRTAAHEGGALLLGTEPRAEQAASERPQVVTLWFTGALDPALSRAQLRDADTRVIAESASVAAEQPSILSIAPDEPLPDGLYLVTYQAVLAQDGHADEGSFRFAVGSETGISADAPWAEMNLQTEASAGSLYVQVFATPGVVGINTLDFLAFDRASGRRLDGLALELVAQAPGDAAQTLTPAALGDGAYRLPDLALPQPGNWIFTLIVTETSGDTHALPFTLAITTSQVGITSRASALGAGPLLPIRMGALVVGAACVGAAGYRLGSRRRRKATQIFISMALLFAGLVLIALALYAFA
jgi:methionine-rich copper-binding protein CopC